MGEFRGWGDPAPYTDKWTNVDPGPPPTAAAPIRDIELPEDIGETPDPDEGYRNPPSSPTDPRISDFEALPEGYRTPGDGGRTPEPTKALDEYLKDHWYHQGDGSKCDAGFMAPTAKPEPRGSWWCTEHQSALEYREPTKALQRWADVAMWEAPEHTDPQKPKAWVVLPPDPLGLMAMVNGQYTGKFYTSPSQVSDEERREAWEAGAVSLLSEAPMEWFQVNVTLDNVSRAFTHQLVRTRMATYAQESQRFAVKTNMGDAVKLPPSLASTIPLDQYRQEFIGDSDIDREDVMFGAPDYDREPERQRWRNLWDQTLQDLAFTYQKLVDSGMPAEDARGILPTNMLTRIHIRIDIKTLIRLAGSRLCTQAQFEWRQVFAEIARAFRGFGGPDHPDRWQYDLVAERFRPVCFAANRCPMQAKSDRHCSIRPQVEAFAAAGVPSRQWGEPHFLGPEVPFHSNASRIDVPWRYKGDNGNRDEDFIPAISPVQWLADPTAARVAPGR